MANHSTIYLKFMKEVCISVSGNADALSDYLTTNEETEEVAIQLIEACLQIIRAYNTNKSHEVQLKNECISLLERSRYEPLYFMKEFKVACSVQITNDQLEHCKIDLDNISTFIQDFSNRVPAENFQFQDEIQGIESQLDIIENCLGQFRKISQVHRNAEYQSNNVEQLQTLANQIFYYLKLLYNYCQSTVELSVRCSKLRDQLIAQSFILSEPPPRFLQKQTNRVPGRNFTMRVRFLLSDSCIQYGTVVKARLLNEAQWVSNSSSPIVPGENPNSWEQQLINNEANFRNIRVQDVERNGDQAVTDAKYIFVFNVIVVPVGTFGQVDSLSVQLTSNCSTVIVQSSQMPEAEATIFWDNNFHLVNRSGFECLTSVGIEDFITALNELYKSRTTKYLTDRNLAYLRSVINNLVNGRSEVTFYEIVHTRILNKSYSFWRWIYYGLRIIHELFDFWKRDLLEGFIHKDEVLTIMNQRNSQSGSFILRFSESTLGGVIICQNKDNMLTPWLPLILDSFRNRPLADYLMEHEDLLHFLTENGLVDKKQVLRPLLQHNEEVNGYVPPWMRHWLRR